MCTQISTQETGIENKNIRVKTNALLSDLLLAFFSAFTGGGNIFPIPCFIWMVAIGAISQTAHIENLSTIRTFGTSWSVLN